MTKNRKEKELSAMYNPTPLSAVNNIDFCGTREADKILIRKIAKLYTPETPLGDPREECLCPNCKTDFYASNTSWGNIYVGEAGFCGNCGKALDWDNWAK